MKIINEEASKKMELYQKFINAAKQSFEEFNLGNFSKTKKSSVSIS